MVKLGLLTLATLAGIWMVLAGMGDEDLRAARRPPAAEPVSAAQDAGAEALPAGSAAADEVVAATSQTPERVERFPGPPLEPSPEHAGETPADAPAPTAVTGDGTRLYVTGTRVNMRSGPGTGNAVVAALDRGTEVEALGEAAGDWVEIRTAAGERGFMSNQFLSPDAP